MVENFLKDWENKRSEWGVSDCHKFIINYLDTFYPSHQMPRIEYSTSFQAIRETKKYNWKDELEKAFNLEFVRAPQDGNLVFEKVYKVPSIFIYFNSMIHTMKPDSGYIKIPFALNENLLIAHLKGVKT